MKSVLSIVWGLWFSLSIQAQAIGQLSPPGLPIEMQVKGLYQIEVDDNSGYYVYEQTNGKLSIAELNSNDNGFYFWLIENNDTRTFQLYSARQPDKLLSIDTDGTAQMIINQKSKSTELVFRMSQIRSKRTSDDKEIVAIGYITTQSLKEYGIKDCHCNGLSLGNQRFKIHKVDAYANNPDLPTKEKVSSVSETLTLYPNPADNQLNFRLIGNKAGEVQVTLLDIAGKALMKTTDTLNQRGVLDCKINISTLNSGYYFIKVRLPDGQNLTEKIIKR